jgi:hypothetical protein
MRTGKKWATLVGNKIVYHGQKGVRISPGSRRGQSYCARSFGITKIYPSARLKTSANYQSRLKWKCRGKKSLR